MSPAGCTATIEFLLPYFLKTHSPCPIEEEKLPRRVFISLFLQENVKSMFSFLPIFASRKNKVIFFIEPCVMGSHLRIQLRKLAPLYYSIRVLAINFRSKFHRRCVFTSRWKQSTIIVPFGCSFADEEKS